MLSGTAYNDYISQELARFALRGLIAKTAVDPAKIDYLVMGTVIQEGTSLVNAGAFCNEAAA